MKKYKVATEKSNNNTIPYLVLWAFLILFVFMIFATFLEGKVDPGFVFFILLVVQFPFCVGFIIYRSKKFGNEFLEINHDYLKFTNLKPETELVEEKKIDKAEVVSISFSQNSKIGLAFYSFYIKRNADRFDFTAMYDVGNLIISDLKRNGYQINN